MSKHPQKSAIVHLGMNICIWYSYYLKKKLKWALVPQIVERKGHYPKQLNYKASGKSMYPYYT